MAYNIWSEFYSIRKKHRMTQVELSLNTGITQADISRIEKGSFNPSYETLYKLASGLNLDITLSEKGSYICQPCYTIIGGVNGSGKSSFSGCLIATDNRLGEVIDVDKITAQLGISAISGGKEALLRIEDSIKSGRDFTQETTLSGMLTANTIMRAHEAGYYVRLYYIEIDSADECIRRIKNRVARGGHYIAEADVRRRFAKRKEDFERVATLCDEVKIFRNDNGFEEVKPQ